MFGGLDPGWRLPGRSGIGKHQAVTCQAPVRRLPRSANYRATRNRIRKGPPEFTTNVEKSWD